MSVEEELTRWIAEIDRSDLGHTYVRLYARAPEWVRYRAQERFGRGTVFLNPVKHRPADVPSSAPVASRPHGQEDALSGRLGYRP